MISTHAVLVYGAGTVQHVDEATSSLHVGGQLYGQQSTLPHPRAVHDHQTALSVNTSGMVGLAPNGSDWLQMGQIWDF